jgi:vacuolar-type H+-ATPase subunit E/Vma4
LSLEKLINKINEKELNIREEIQAENNEELAKIQEKLDNEIAISSETQKKITNDKIEFLKQKESTQLDIDQRKQMLNIKREVIKEVYEDFRLAVAKMTSSEYKEWLTKKIANLEIVNALGKLIVGIGLFDKDSIDEQFKNTINDLVKVEVEYTDEIDFGFKYEYSAIIINNTLESIVAEFKLEKELELSKILFG